MDGGLFIGWAGSGWVGGEQDDFHGMGLWIEDWEKDIFFLGPGDCVHVCFL